jgi:hypothetical protein
MLEHIPCGVLKANHFNDTEFSSAVVTPLLALERDELSANSDAAKAQST